MILTALLLFLLEPINFLEGKEFKLFVYSLLVNSSVLTFIHYEEEKQDSEKFASH